jgi:membrane associated rhomboid family serine protease
LLLISALQLGLYYTQDVPLDAPNNQLIYNPCLRQEAWPRYLTYIFAHGNGSQLAANLIAQLTLGCVLELVHRWRIIAVYLVSALGGCLMHSVVQGDTFTLGAGGAVFGLMGARLVNILLNFFETVCCVCRTKSDNGRRTRIKILTYFTCGKIVQFLFVLVCSALSIIDAMRFVDYPGNSDTQADLNPGYLGYNANSPGVSGSRTDEKRIALTTRRNGVHLGGLATGAVMGILVLQSISDKQADRKLKLVCLFLLLTFVLFTIGWNVFYVGFPATNSAVCHTSSELSLISSHYSSDRIQNTNVGNVG